MSKKDCLIDKLYLKISNDFGECKHMKRYLKTYTVERLIELNDIYQNLYQYKKIFYTDLYKLKILIKLYQYIDINLFINLSIKWYNNIMFIINYKGVKMLYITDNDHLYTLNDNYQVNQKYN